MKTKYCKSSCSCSTLTTAQNNVAAEDFDGYMRHLFEEQEADKVYEKIVGNSIKSAHIEKKNVKETAHEEVRKKETASVPLDDNLDEKSDNFYNIQESTDDKDFRHQMAKIRQAGDVNQVTYLPD
jgi:hypothetical protein